jgi:hypothetical protein
MISWIREMVQGYHKLSVLEYKKRPDSLNHYVVTNSKIYIHSGRKKIMYVLLRYLVMEIVFL